MHRSPVDRAAAHDAALPADVRTRVDSDASGSERRTTWRRFFLQCTGCCGMYLLALITIVVFVAYGIARSGLIEIPFVSAHVTHARTPHHVVAASAHAPSVERDMANAIRGARSRNAHTFAVDLTEAMFSDLLRQQLITADDHPFALRSVQVAILPSGIELFGHAQGFDRSQTTILLRGVPTIQDSRLAITSVDVAAVGNVGLPRSIVHRALDAALRNQPEIALPAGGLTFRPSSLTLGSGSMSLTFSANDVP